MKHMEYGENMRMAKARAAMDVWMRWIASAWQADQGLPKAMPVAKTANRFLLTGVGCPSQTVTTTLNMRKIE